MWPVPCSRSILLPTVRERHTSVQSLTHTAAELRKYATQPSFSGKHLTPARTRARHKTRIDESSFQPGQYSHRPQQRQWTKPNVLPRRLLASQSERIRPLKGALLSSEITFNMSTAEERELAINPIVHTSVQHNTQVCLAYPE